MTAWLALPGTLLDARSLAPLQSALGVDPGLWHVEVLGTEPALDDEIDRLAAVSAALSARGAGPVIVLGHSLGGIVALHLALRHPTAVAALVLMAANARAGDARGGVSDSESGSDSVGRSPSASARRAAQWQAARQQGLSALATAKLAPGYGLTGDAAAEQLLAAQAETVGLQRFAHQLGYAAQRPGLLQPQRRLAVPLLALSADGDVLCPPDQGHEIAGLSHEGKCRVLAGAGHLFPWLQPQWTAQQISDFLSHKLRFPNRKDDVSCA